MRPSFALWGRCGGGEEGGRGKGVAVRVEAARFAAQEEGSAQEGEPPMASVCAEMTLRVQGSPKGPTEWLSVLRGGNEGFVTFCLKRLTKGKTKFRL